MNVEEGLIEKIRYSAKNAKEEGWSLTKQAMITIDQTLKEELTEKAKEAYKQPLNEINHTYLFDNLTDKFLKEIKLQIIEVNINVFDLYRRVGKLDDAMDLGEITFEEAIKTEDVSTIIRAGNFLTLVQSAEAYKLMDVNNEDFTGALEKYYDIEEIFNLMLDDFKDLGAKNSVMSYTNMAANHLNIVHASLASDFPISFLEIELRDAYKLTKEADTFLECIPNKNDRVVWKSNIHKNFGDIARYKEDFDDAIEHYEKALEESQKSGYELQTAILNTLLSHSFNEKPGNGFEKAKEHYDSIKIYLNNGNDFGIYNFMIQPLVTELEASFK